MADFTARAGRRATGDGSARTEPMAGDAPPGCCDDHVRQNKKRKELP
jgi:hypothetical protein